MIATPARMSVRGLAAWAVTTIGTLGPTAIADVSFSAPGVAVTINSQGKVSSLMDTTANKERLRAESDAYRPYVCNIKTGGQQHYPTSMQVAGNRLTFTFGTLSPAPTVAVVVEQKSKYLVFRIDSVSSQHPLEWVRFFHARTAAVTEFGARFMSFFDDNGDGSADRVMGLVPLDVFTWTSAETTEGVPRLHCAAHTDLPHPDPVTPVGRKAALFTAAADQPGVFGVAQVIQGDYNIPVGVAAKQLPALRRSCFFWQRFTREERDLALQYTLQAGAGRVMLLHELWGDRRRKYNPANGVWNDAADLAAWVNQCKAAGLVVGAHLFPGLIFKDSIDYIYAGCDSRLHRDHTLTLAAALPAGQTDGLIQTTTSPAGWPVAANDRDLVIDQEIIQYTSLRTTPPYGLVGPFIRAKNQTGGGGLGPQNHAAGATVGHLVSDQSGQRYQWGIASGGVQQWCSDLAGRLDAAGFQFVFTDGAELTQEPLWYSLAYLMQTIYDQMQNKPLLFETSSNLYGYSWWLLGVDGYIDYYVPANPFKREVDRNVEHMLEVSGFLPRQLGWTRLGDSNYQPACDELEYALAKSIAYDVPIVFHVWMYGMQIWPNRDANLHLMAKYEQLRLDGYFPTPVRLAARRTGKDFMLFTDDGGQHHLVPTSLLTVASWSPHLRGFITDQPIGGCYYATLWPAKRNTTVRLRLDGVRATDLVASEYDGDPIQIAEIGGGQVELPVSTRVYIRLVNVPDPLRVFYRSTAYQQP